MGSHKILVSSLIILGVLSLTIIFWQYRVNSAYQEKTESYIACGCGCCSIDKRDLKAECLYRSKGDSMAIVIATDKLLSKSPQCALVGCAFPVKYQYCD